MLSVKSSTIHGRGVFASRTLSQGETLETGHLLVLDRSEDERPSTLADTYSFEFGDTQRCLALGVVSLCNHSYAANAEMFIDQKTLTYQLVAQRCIERGDEVLLDYGVGYWEDLGVAAL